MNAASSLSRSEIRAVYDDVGRWQDTQGVYEKPAIDALIAHGRFGDAASVFEVGCGTGRVAERLLRAHCPPGTRYEGVDLSPTMVQIARDRLGSYADRARVRRSDGAFAYDRPAATQDRVLATYVLDLLAPADIRALLAEAHRLLRHDGRLCVAGLTWGTRPLGRLVTALWAWIHRCRPAWVGGCRPLRARRFLDPSRWHVEHHAVVRAWGVPSEVIVAAPA